ncbi:MAG: DUF1376 domain-containing protein, partial [Roseomonas mucosa]|nr:DUF1376 domain-containing protein [Roseomonas mucosa]
MSIDSASYMPLYAKRLMRSETWLLAEEEPDVGFYLINLWLAAFHGTPAGGLEANDLVLRRLAKCTSKRWPEVRDMVMRGFVLHADGRLYHPVVTENVLAVLAKRRAKSEAGKAGNAKRWGNRGAGSQSDGDAVAAPSQGDHTPIAEPSQTDRGAITPQSQSDRSAIAEPSHRDRNAIALGSQCDRKASQPIADSDSDSNKRDSVEPDGSPGRGAGAPADPEGGPGRGETVRTEAKPPRKRPSRAVAKVEAMPEKTPEGFEQCFRAYGHPDAPLPAIGCFNQAIRALEQERGHRDDWWREILFVIENTAFNPDRQYRKPFFKWLQEGNWA